MKIVVLAGGTSPERDVSLVSGTWSEGIQPVKEINPDLKEIHAMRERPEDGFFGPNVIDICKMADLVFLALHGMNGEDGRIQAALSGRRRCTLRPLIC